jgi:trimeric autotransporter adhesin
MVQMPEWFESLNRDFRYQLTVIGQFAQAIVASEMANHSFTIQTDKPNVKVSWQVTGIRQDAWANAHRIPVEQLKSEKERGLYLHPELFGAPLEKSIGAARHPGVMKLMKEGKTKLPDSTKQ